MWRDNRESYRNYLRNFKEVSSCVESNNFISLVWNCIITHCTDFGVVFTEFLQDL